MPSVPVHIVGVASWPEAGVPAHPIYWPPPGIPAAPIAPGGETPTHPIAPGGQPGTPAHPIYIPVYPAHPIELPPGTVPPDMTLEPSHPIYIPVYPSHPVTGLPKPSQPIAGTGVGPSQPMEPGGYEPPPGSAHPTPAEKKK
jgi:hypothetical protein